MVNGDVTKDNNDKGAIGGGIYDVDDDKEWETLSGTVGHTCVEEAGDRIQQCEDKAVTLTVYV
jgi:hypothetical protein